MRLLFEGGYYSGCGYYSSKYGIWRPGLHYLLYSVLRPELIDHGHEICYLDVKGLAFKISSIECRLCHNWNTNKIALMFSKTSIDFKIPSERIIQF